MAGKVHDRQPLSMDRDPSKQLAVEVGSFPKASPIDLVTAFANALEEYGLEAIEEVTGLDLSGLKKALDNLKALLGGVDLFGGDDFDPVAAVTQFFGSIPAAVLGLLGGADWGELLGKLTGGFTGGGDPLAALANFFKVELGAPITAGRLPLIPLSHIRDVQPNLLTDGSFDNEETLEGFPDWDWDDSTGRTRPGCAYTMADGNTHTLHSNTIEVGPLDELDVEVWAKWGSLVVTGAGAVQLAIAAYRADRTLIGGGPAVVASAGGAGSAAVWVKLSSTKWPVPDDAAYVVLELTLTTAATSGSLRLDDASVSKTGALPQSYVAGLTGALQAAADRVQGVINQVWTGITRQVLDGPKNLADLFEVLGAIPAGNVGGVGGLPNIGASLTETWTQLWGGFAQAIGAGKSIADAANAAGNVAGTADTAQQISVWNNAILELRNNKSLMEGMDETSESNFLLSDLLAGGGDPPLILATAASSPFSFWRARETAQKGFISWYGKGIANVTGLYLDIYRFNYATSAVDVLHTSPNQIGQFPADGSWKLGLYYLPALSRFQVNAGDVIGVAWRVTGTGTHSIAGKLGAWLPADASTEPQKPAAALPAGGPFAGATFAALAPYYTGNTAWFGIGIAAGDVPMPYNAPRQTEIQAPGAYSIQVEPWMNIIEGAYLGAGGGGRGGNGGNTVAGEGGGAGQWTTETLVRGVDFPANWNGTITGVVGTGGVGGPKEGRGTAGTATTRAAIPGGKAQAVAAGGLRGEVEDNSVANGDSAGTVTLGGVNYVGGNGGAGGRPGAAGGAAGGGGGGGFGGIYTVGYAGGPGGRGGAWFRAKQS